ncbi:helix-turn-helix domain-containing protein [Planococcus lenghuensis]|uniref:Helicase Helix-turn-helix domain-containing protein n=1 Tax=Planococcus lenghuensis TaxID=2213202 RepID=A0A1Q2L0R7_9BACL|nr:helix-turn-helix domain-containing protein [Planococcus lenghuensis]AQQ53647.1 hypothetical protein B0X71_11550 [Planococcus lenghuensis]
MSFEEAILAIMKKLNGQRTVSAPYHVLKGKKSGQTIQDIGYFSLHPFFGVMPALKKEKYDEAVAALRYSGFIGEADKQIRLLAGGEKLALPEHHFNGWKYQGRERLFFARLSLVIQTLSHKHQGIRVFDPVQNRTDIQQWVKKYLMDTTYAAPETYKAFKEEMERSLGAAATGDDGKSVLLGRFSGYGISGQTWQQMAAERGCSEMDVRLAATETLHSWLDEISDGDYPLLIPFLEDVIRRSALTDSTRRTIHLFKEGHSMEEIAAIRRLRPSTIEDHFVEMAMNDPAFDVTQFMKREDYDRVSAVSRGADTKRLRDIKEQLPDLSYFQIRLALSAKGGET